MRDCSDTVKLGSGVVPSLQVRHLCPSQSVGFDRLQPVVLLAGVFQRYTQDSKIAVAEVLVCFHEVRIFFPTGSTPRRPRSEEHTSELQSRENLVCRLLLEKKKNLIRKELLPTSLRQRRRRTGHATE